MARGCSDSDSEEERHDRFKSERNLKSTSLLRTKVPGSLENYSSRARSPLRSDHYKSSRHKSRYSEERKNSPYRRGKSPENKLSRDRKSPPILIDSTKSFSLDCKSSKHSSKRNHEKRRDDDKYDGDQKKSREKDDKQLQAEQKYSRERDHKHRSDSKKRSQEDEIKPDCIKRRKSRDVTVSDRNSVVDNIYSDKGSDSSVNIRSDNENDPSSDVEVEMLPRYYEMASDKVTADVENKSNSDKSLRKHKRSKEKSQNHHDSKKRKKDKKHKRKHVKRTSESDSSSKVIEKQSEDIQEKVDSCEDAKDLDVVLKDIDEKDNVAVNTQTEELLEEKNTSEQEEGELSASESEQYFGPALPPKMSPESDHGADSPSPDVFGPALPPTLTTTTSEVEVEEEDGTFIGPLPPGQENLAQAELDARASLLRNQMENKQTEDAAAKREAWMTELPEVRGAQIGLGPRKFRNNPCPDMSDRSSWTDTPQEKEKKKLLNYEEDPTEIDTEKLEILARNKEMELLAKKSEKKSKSLLDIHQKEIKKKKKKEQKERGDQPEERRPFSREIDLETRTLNSAQKRSVIKKSQLLDSRFSSGESKYL